MGEGTLLTTAAATAVTGIAFTLVALQVGRIPAAAEHRFARNAHVAWWACLGAYLVLQAVLTALASFDRLSASHYMWSRVLAIPLLCTAVWGLCTYLVFLYTGAPRARIVLGLLYASVAVLFAYSTFVATPELVVTDWLVSYQDDSALYRSIYVLVGLPPIAASVAYLALRKRVRDPLQRRRLVLTSTGILAYVASGLSARLFASDVLTFLTLVPLGLLSAAAIVAAHVPPRSAEDRPVQAREDDPADEALARRLRELL